MNARALCVAMLISPAVPALADGVGATAIEAAGTSFPAIVAGEGAPVVFVHGMLADDRAWAGYADATVAGGHRFIAYTQRGFGPGTSADEPFSRDQHIADLAAILEVVDAPVDLVAWSYGGAVALGAAVAVPDRVRRIVLYEPWVEGMIVDKTPAQQAADDAFGATLGPTAAAMDAGDVEGAARAATEGFLGLGPDGFASQPAEVQENPAGQCRELRGRLERPLSDADNLRRHRCGAGADADRRRFDDAARLRRDVEGRRRLCPGGGGGHDGGTGPRRSVVRTGGFQQAGARFCRRVLIPAGRCREGRRASMTLSFRGG